jgi:hypothetical protein
MNIRHAGLHVLPELELLRAFADLDGPDLPGPFVEVLEQVTMDGPKMGKIEYAVGDVLPGAHNDKATLDFL